VAANVTERCEYVRFADLARAPTNCLHRGRPSEPRRETSSCPHTAFAQHRSFMTAWTIRISRCPEPMEGPAGERCGGSISSWGREAGNCSRPAMGHAILLVEEGPRWARDDLPRNCGVYGALLDAILALWAEETAG